MYLDYKDQLGHLGQLVQLVTPVRVDRKEIKASWGILVQLAVKEL